ncbi:MAG TPA: PD-(D/E)XK nuclease family protein [Chthoniobacterales bacterium]|nr:PD-(D/E)XK nuclease family protein [Chthoniobacterales bacterium]
MQVSLHLSSSFNAAWEHIIAAWFESAAESSLRGRNFAAVVMPYRSHAHFLRAQLLARGVSLLGIRFLTPPQLRELLLRNSGLNIPLREHLRMLLAAAAEEFAAEVGENNSRAALIARSVARDPDNFLRAIDQLDAAGWDVTQFQPPALREIAARFKKRVRDCSFVFVHEADRQAVPNAASSPVIFGNLLVTGFDGAHWPLWPLLRAAVLSSTAATVILNDPRDEARELDETWVGTWEETFGAAEPVSEEVSANTLPDPCKRRAQACEGRRATLQQKGKPLENVHFVVGRDNTEQARAIAALTAKFLGDENCERIGILFPSSGPLPRLVADFLESAKIAHNDGIAHLTPSVFDDDAFRAWLDLQQKPRVKFLLAFLRATHGKLFEAMPLVHVEEVLRRAYAEVLLDNIDILRAYCARDRGDSRNAAVARGLERIQFLPANAPFPEFLSQTRKIFTQFGWKEHWSEVDRLSRGWSVRCSDLISKNNYLRWLREILSAPSLTRGDFGSHAYSRVHLLPYAEAENQTWSHLIFAGLNEEAWPSLDDELGFVPEQELEEFNRTNKMLNRRAVQRGRFGEGQYCVAKDKTLLLGASERRQIRRRQLVNLIESASTGIGVSANLYSEAFPSRTANPNDFFSWLYFAAHGRGVSQRTLQTLEIQTRAWLKNWSPVDAQKIDSVSLGRTRYGFDMRRKLAPAGEYEFALRTPPDRQITLRVTEWEQALRWPALIWMKIFLGIGGDAENGDAWRVATGQWAHRWLADAAQPCSHGSINRSGETGHPPSQSFGAASTPVATETAFMPISRAEEIRACIVDLAKEFRARVHELCRECNKPLPDWWISGWSNALYISDCLAAKLADLENDWSHMAVEWPLGSPATISLGENETLRLRGRIDLMLATGERDKSPAGYPALWVIDYKTGRQRGFNLRDLRRHESSEQKFCKQLIDGRGVQLALYALAVHALGARDVRLTLLSPAGDLEPQFHLRDALAQKDFWRELHRMQETGVFGMRGPVHTEYGFARAYPLATLPIDPDLIEEKWTLTHPPFGEPTAS